MTMALCGVLLYQIRTMIDCRLAAKAVGSLQECKDKVLYVQSRNMAYDTVAIARM